MKCLYCGNSVIPSSGVLDRHKAKSGNDYLSYITEKSKRIPEIQQAIRDRNFPQAMKLFRQTFNNWREAFAAALVYLSEMSKNSKNGAQTKIAVNKKM